MHSFHKHVGADEHFTVGIMEHGAVVAHTVKSGFVLGKITVGESVYESEFSEF